MYFANSTPLQQEAEDTSNITLYQLLHGSALEIEKRIKDSFRFAAQKEKDDVAQRLVEWALRAIAEGLNPRWEAYSDAEKLRAQIDMVLWFLTVRQEIPKTKKLLFSILIQYWGDERNVGDRREAFFAILRHARSTQEIILCTEALKDKCKNGFPSPVHLAEALRIMKDREGYGMPKWWSILAGAWGSNINQNDLLNILALVEPLEGCASKEFYVTTKAAKEIRRAKDAADDLARRLSEIKPPDLSDIATSAFYSSDSIFWIQAHIAASFSGSQGLAEGAAKKLASVAADTIQQWKKETPKQTEESPYFHCKLYIEVEFKDSSLSEEGRNPAGTISKIIDF